MSPGSPPGRAGAALLVYMCNTVLTQKSSLYLAPTKNSPLHIDYFRTTQNSEKLHNLDSDLHSINKYILKIS